LCFVTRKLSKLSLYVFVRRSSKKNSNYAAAFLDTSGIDVQHNGLQWVRNGTNGNSFSGV
jgi:hypothetical protein